MCTGGRESTKLLTSMNALSTSPLTDNELAAHMLRVSSTSTKLVFFLVKEVSPYFRTPLTYFASILAKLACDLQTAQGVCLIIRR